MTQLISLGTTNGNLQHILLYSTKKQPSMVLALFITQYITVTYTNVSVEIDASYSYLVKHRRNINTVIHKCQFNKVIFPYNEEKLQCFYYLIENVVA